MKENGPLSIREETFVRALSLAQELNVVVKERDPFKIFDELRDEQRKRMDILRSSTSSDIELLIDLNKGLLPTGINVLEKNIVKELDGKSLSSTSVQKIPQMLSDIHVLQQVLDGRWDWFK